MNTTIITSAWDTIIQYFFPVFTAPTAQTFLHLVTGWILCTARHTITGILPFADPAGRRAHDAYHRFFPDATWAMSELWRLLTILLVRIFYPTGVIPTDLDDTLFHRTGRKVNGAGWWRDAVRSTGNKTVHAWGLNLVVVTLRINPPWGGEPLGLPINMRIHRKNGPTLIKLAKEMLAEVALWLPQRRFLCSADGFYASLAGEDIPNTHIISRMRRDANIYDLLPRERKKQRGRPRKKGRRVPSPEKLTQRVTNWQLIQTCERGKIRERLVYARKVVWYRVSEKPVLLVISRDPTGKEKDDFFFTTDLSLTAAEVIGAVAGRWSIEDTFKNTKQFIGGQEPQTWKGQGPERAAALSLWIYSVVWLWYVQQRSRRRYFFVRPWYPGKTVASFADALSCLRRVLWRDRIKFMFGKRFVHNKKFEFLIEALALAA
ncbi:MAG: transposase [Sedimentisphaerales bacterium]